MKTLSEMFNKIISYVFIKINEHRFFSKFQDVYGSFLISKDYQKFSFSLSNESKIFYGEIAKVIMDLSEAPRRVLLPGENAVSKQQIYQGLKIKLEKSEIITAGLSRGVDYRWDFEEDPPQIGKFSLIISQAMLEHLVDPYKHIKDLANYLDTGGYLIVHSVLPGFTYHRYPIDTLRFHPDWFEEIAEPKRCNLKIVKKHIRDFNIFYVYQKV